MKKNRVVDIIVPVYDGFEETRDCLLSVFESLPLNKTAYELVVINDASPSSKLTAWLQVLAEEGKISLSVNPKNLGFVKTVNKGMSLHDDHDVILLNSDTIVANDWLDRMVEVADEDETIASVTPFSNNAEICSFPNFCKSNELPANTSVADVDNLFKQLDFREPIDVPTGVGFCMYISRKSLNEVGLFDEKRFGRGYGEENDFCMRSAKAGFRNVFATNTFVYHAGGVSFGKEKLARVERAMQTLDKLYPDYHKEVHQHLQKNPARTLRIFAFLQLLKKQNTPCVLAIVHKLGGGTDKHVIELADHIASKAHTLVIKPGDGNSMRLYLTAEKESDYLEFGFPENYSDLLFFLQHLNIVRLHCHHIMGIDPQLWRLIDDLNVPMDVTMHDYYFINASPTLVDEEAQFVADKSQRDELCAKYYPVPGGATAEQWRAAQAAFLSKSDRIFTPCQWTADMYAEYFPGLNYVPVSHPDDENFNLQKDVQIRPLKRSQNLKVMVLGALGREKGADILDSCARIADLRGEKIKFTLVGYGYRELDKCIEKTGPYNEHELQDLIEEHQPHLIWFPCRWPETYSYTLSTCLEMGLPIAAPDIGSFPERLSGRPWSWVLPWDTAPEVWLQFFTDRRNEFLNEKAEGFAWRARNGNPDFNYEENYLLIDAAAEKEKPEKEMTLESVFPFTPKTYFSGSGSQELSDKEKWLLLLLHYRNNPFVNSVIRAIPFKIQQKFKRSLSSRPIHEVINQAHYTPKLIEVLLPRVVRKMFGVAGA